MPRAGCATKLENKPMDGRLYEVPTSRFLRACYGLAVDTTPIWLMRQAGRYMPEYQQLAKQHSFWQLVKEPELACEITLQPINAFEVDAAIIFADILPLIQAMGLRLDFAGPEQLVVENPIRSGSDIAALRVPEPEEDLWFTLEAIRLVRKELDHRGIPLLGFSGSPFTLASYAIESGGNSKRAYLRQHTKTMLMSAPDQWHQLMSKLAEAVGQYLLAQARAGAHALHLFDSWANVLSAGDYQTYVLPYTRRAIEIARAARVPILYFSTLPSNATTLARATGSDVLGVDWSHNLDTVWQQIGPHMALQGNLDPIALLAPWPELKVRAQAVLDQVAGRPGYIFNLGGGIVSHPDVDNVRRLVDFVHEYSATHRRITADMYLAADSRSRFTNHRVQGEVIT
jgi:uroporphyrinogen decarboxylase